VDRNANNKVIATVTKDTPDQVLFQSTLTNGTVLTVHLRGGKPFPGNPPALWRIYGDKGEIEVTGPKMSLNVVTDGVVIRLHDQLTDELEEVEWEKDQWDDLPIPARNIGRLYEAYRKGETEGVVEFEEAVGRHNMLDDMYKAWDNGAQGRIADFTQSQIH
jgi:predicted dehydrogenase